MLPHTITGLKAAYADGSLTPTAAIEQLDAAISAGDAEVGAYLSRDLDAALAAAQNADISLPLGGIPIAIKDNMNVLGEPCTCASKFLEKGYTAPYDATVISRLRAAGAIPFGRLNMDEFAMGSATENSALGVTRNPHDLERIPGGSSGGSAAAVAAKTAIAALGSDTGGSIRQPASHCGVVGLKPSYGRISRYGLVAFASSLDQIGPVTHTVEDAAHLLQAIAGHDPLDSTSIDAPVDDFISEIDAGVAGKKIGLPQEYLDAEGLSPEIKAGIAAAADRLAAAGAEIVDISLPHTDYAVATYYIIAPAEASSNLSRFDGIRYGYRAADPTGIEDLNRRSREYGFGPEVKRRIILGTYVLSGGYYDAYYSRAQKIRTLIRQDFTEAFGKCDLILTPTVPAPARKLGENANDPLAEYLADIFTIAANLAGIAGISVPNGTVEVDGKALPVGAQLMAPAFGEKTLLQAAKVLEQG